MKEVFKAGSVAEDEDTIMKNFQRYAQNTINEMLRLEPLYQTHPYPGRKVLDQGKRLMQSVIQIQAPLEFFQYVSKMRETFYDFADDYEPVKSFFGGEQKEIFTRALEMLAIYDDSKTYIVDRDLEDVVREIRGIVGQPQPYKNIPKLPALRDSFLEAYSKILKREEKPVLDAIDQAKNRVMEVLTAREYAATYKERYSAQFAEICTGAERCNNVSALRSYADKAEALKIRLLNEITTRDNEIARRKAEEARKRAEEAAKKAEQEGKPAPEFVEDTTTEYKYKKTTNIRIKDITHTASWRVETPEDVDKYLADLKKNLLSELDTTDILNVEF